MLKSDGIKFTENVHCYYRKYLNSNSLSNHFSKTSLESSFKALELKEKHLTPVINSSLKFALSKYYLNLAITAYPYNFTVYKKSFQKHRLYGGLGNPTVYLGGKIAKTLATYIDWRIIKSISFIKNILKYT